MFMVSLRLSRIKVVVCALALVLAVSAGVVGVKKSRGEQDVVSTAVPEQAADTAEPADKSEKAEKVKVKKISAKTNDQRTEFARSFGWEVEEEPVQVIEVIIPAEFDQVYQEYNSIQKKQGLDLEKYAGKRVKRYSYTVTNYPGATGEVRLNLLVYKDKVIGGDVSSMEENGAVHGLAGE